MSLFRRAEKRSMVTVEDLIGAAQAARGGTLLGRVDRESALAHSAVWACVRLIAGTMSTFPKVEIVDGQQVQSSALITNPSALVSPIGWTEQLVSSMLLRGAAVGLVVQQRDYPTQVELLDPSSVGVDVVEGRMLFKLDDGLHERWPLGDVVYAPGFLMPGSPVGVSVLKYAAIAIQEGLAAERFGADFFVNGAVPTGVITAPGEINQDQAKVIKDRYMASMQHKREPLVLGAGSEYRQVTINPDDSQFLDTQRFSAEAVCRFFGVAPEMIGVASSGQSVTYANREQRMSDFLALTLGPWIARVEEFLSSLRPPGTEVRFRTGALLRADLMTRYQSYEIAASINLLSVEEMRAFEDLGPRNA